MFARLALVSLFSLALAAPQHAPLPQAAKYPAGVSPHDCPNFPLCDNERLHNPQAHWAAPATHWAAQPAQHWNPAWNAPAAHHWAAPAASSWAPSAPSWHDDTSDHSGAGGDKYPAGVNPHTCPNYPFCDVNAGHHHAAAAPPLPGYTERLYPAGVSPHECPNFPYCH